MPVARPFPAGLRFGRVALLALAVASTGCATLRATMDGYATGPRGISKSQQQLRVALAHGDFVKAYASRDDDALLRALDAGIVSYYASQFERSAAVLDSAALLADDRITASLSKDALALVTNDMARPYQPRRTERLFIPYYGMLAYARLGAWEDAAVEARRLVALLAQYADDRDDAERTLDATLQYLAGAVFERAGERGEAEVADRIARSLAPAPSDSGARARAGSSETGELLVVIERGFVAHRTTETIDVELGQDGREGRDDRSPWEPASDHPGPHDRHADGGDDRYHLTVAFPALRQSARLPGGTVSLAVDGAAAAAWRLVSVVDDASAVDARRERAGLIARATARATAKYAVTKAIKDKKGEVAGTLANIGATLLERADVRSWHLLPREISLLRIRLPAGSRNATLWIGTGPDARSVTLGTVAIRAGTVTIAPVRLWEEARPNARAPVTTSSPILATADSAHY